MIHPVTKYRGNFTCEAAPILRPLPEAITSFTTEIYDARVGCNGDAKYFFDAYGVFTQNDSENDLCSETNEMAKSSQWQHWQDLSAVWTPSYNLMSAILIGLAIFLGISLGIAKCENAITDTLSLLKS